MKKKTKKGFSLIEVMVLLTIFAVVMAASMPIISKRTKTPPKIATHGVYRCIANDDGSYTEELYSATNKLKSAKVASCSFDVPQAASYTIDLYTAGAGGTKYAAYQTKEGDSGNPVKIDRARIHKYFQTGDLFDGIKNLDFSKDDITDNLFERLLKNKDVVFKMSNIIPVGTNGMSAKMFYDDPKTAHCKFGKTNDTSSITGYMDVYKNSTDTIMADAEDHFTSSSITLFYNYSSLITQYNAYCLMKYLEAKNPTLSSAHQFQTDNINYVDIASNSITQFGGTATAGAKPFLVLSYKFGEIPDVFKKNYRYKLGFDKTNANNEEKYPSLCYLAQLSNHTNNNNTYYEYKHKHTYFPVLAQAQSIAQKVAVSDYSNFLNYHPGTDNNRGSLNYRHITVKDASGNTTLNYRKYDKLHQYVKTKTTKINNTDKSYVTRDCRPVNNRGGFDQNNCKEVWTLSADSVKSLAGTAGDPAGYYAAFYLPGYSIGDTNISSYVATAQKTFSKGGSGGKIDIDPTYKSDFNSAYYDYPEFHRQSYIGKPTEDHCKDIETNKAVIYTIGLLGGIGNKQCYVNSTALAKKQLQTKDAYHMDYSWRIYKHPWSTDENANNDNAKDGVATYYPKTTVNNATIVPQATSEFVDFDRFDIKSTLWKKGYKVGGAGTAGSHKQFVSNYLGSNCKFTVPHGGEPWDIANNEKKPTIGSTAITCKDGNNRVVFNESYDKTGSYNETIPDAFDYTKWGESSTAITIGPETKAVSELPATISKLSKVANLVTPLSEYGVGKSGDGTMLEDRCLAKKGTLDIELYLKRYNFKNEDKLNVMKKTSLTSYVNGSLYNASYTTPTPDVNPIAKRSASSSSSGGKASNGWDCYKYDSFDSNTKTGERIITKHNEKKEMANYTIEAGKGGGAAVVITW